MSPKLKNNRFNVCEYLYYRTTVIYSKVEKSAGYADNKNRGAWAVGTCVSVNVATIIFGIMLLFFSTEITSLKHDTLIRGTLIGITILILGYSLFYFTEKHHAIIFNKYKNESQPLKEKRGKIVFAYVIFSFIALSFIVYIGSEMHSIPK
jgi:uncharacterized membrane protein